MKPKIGIDIESVMSIKKLIKEKEFIQSIFTEKEIIYCKSKLEPSFSFAGIFCAKEALKKVLEYKVDMKDVEIKHDELGAPYISINGKISKNLSCSISHSDEYAVAAVLQYK